MKPKRIGDSDGCGETAYGRTNLEEQETDDRGIGDHGHDTNFTESKVGWLGTEVETSRIFTMARKHS